MEENAVFFFHAWRIYKENSQGEGICCKAPMDYFQREALYFRNCQHCQQRVGYHENRKRGYKCLLLQLFVLCSSLLAPTC